MTADSAPTTADSADSTATTPASAPVEHPTAQHHTEQHTRPPLRWGGVVWGLLLMLFSSGMLFVLSAPERLAAVELWLSVLTPGSVWALWLAAAGLLIVVFALLGVLRSAQRRHSV